VASTGDGPEQPFQGHTVIVTGAANGIGEATARAFAALGAAVVLADISDTDELAAELAGRGAEVLPSRTDVTKADRVEEMVATSIARFGRLDVLVNAAGGFQRRIPTWEMSDEEWDGVVELNLKSVFLCSRAVLPAMIERRRGRIVNVASGAGRTATHVTTSPYSAAKGGVLAFTRHLAREVAPHGITVNAVAPGVTLSPRIEQVYDDSRRQELEAMVPLGRLARPDDQAGPIVILASAAAAYITGATLDVNGGRYMF